MAVGIGQRLLNGAQDGVPGDGARLVEGVLSALSGIEVDFHAGLPVAIDGAGDISPDDGGLVPRAIIVEHVEDLTQLFACLGRHGSNRAGGVGGPFGIKIGTTGQGCGMQRDQGDALGQGIVHFARDVSPFLRTARATRASVSSWWLMSRMPRSTAVTV